MAKKKKAGRPRLSGGCVPVHLRLPAELLARAEALAARIDEEARVAVNVTRYAERVSSATVLRHALLVGLEKLEQEAKRGR